MKPVAKSQPESPRVSTGQSEMITIFPTVLTMSDLRREKDLLEL